MDEFELYIDLDIEFYLDKKVFEKDGFIIARVTSTTKAIKGLLHPIYRNCSIKGKMPNLKHSLLYEATIKGIESSKYGYTLEVTNVYPKNMNSDSINTDSDILSFIEVFIGEGTAKKVKDVKGICNIVKNNDLDRLMEVKGVGVSTAKKIIETYNKEAVGSKYFVKLKKLGFTDKEVIKLSAMYDDNLLLAWEQVNKNIFHLVFNGFQLQRMDKIFLENIGKDKFNKNRIKAYIYKTFEKCLYESGMSYVKLEEFMGMDIVSNIKENMGEVGFNQCMKDLIKDKRIFVINKEYITTYSIYNNDVGLYMELKRLIGNNNKCHVDFDIDEQIAYEEQLHGITLNADQRNAVKSILSNKCSLLVGSGGTGKTFTLKIILNILERMYDNFDSKLVALSGKASKVMAESTDREASTIHRLLGFSIGGFKFNRDNPMPVDFLVVDEVSMCDYSLLNALLSAIPDRTRVLFVGDACQLQSCAGLSNTIYDLSRIPNINFVQLNIVMRQALASGILSTCNDIRVDKNPFKNVPHMIYGELQDMEVFISNDKYQEMIDNYCDNFDVNNRLDYTVLCTTKKMASRINMDIQKGLIKRKKLKPVGNYIEIFTGLKDAFDKPIKMKIYKDDILMVTQNNYQLLTQLEYELGKSKGSLSLFNGNTCIVTEVYEDAVKVETDGEEYIILSDYYDILSSGMCYTIHKSQGSTIKYTYIYLEDNYVNRHMLLVNEGLYTGISRGKSSVKMYAETFGVLRNAVKNRETNNRSTVLDLVIKEKIKIK